MKEIHAYRNEDGTYQVRVICEDICVDGKLHPVVQYIPLAKINIEALAVPSSGEVYSLMVEEKKDELP